MKILPVLSFNKNQNILPLKAANQPKLNQNGNINLNLSSNNILNRAHIMFASAYSFIPIDRTRIITDVVPKEKFAQMSAKQVFEAVGIEAEEDKDGMLTISEYRQPKGLILFSELGINEDDLLSKVVEIKGNADFECSEATSMGSVTKVGGNINTVFSNIKSLNQLSSVGGNATFDKEVVDFGELTSVGGDLHVENCHPLKNKVEYVGGDIYTDGNKRSYAAFKKVIRNQASKIFPKGLSNYSLREKLNTLGISSTELIDGQLILSEYRKPHKYLTFKDFGIDENELFQHIAVIDGDADFCGTEVQNLGNLTYIIGNANFNGSKVKDLGKLKQIYGNCCLVHSKVSPDRALTITKGKITL